MIVRNWFLHDVIAKLREHIERNRANIPLKLASTCRVDIATRFYRHSTFISFPNCNIREIGIKLELYLRRLLERAKISPDSDHRICQSADKRIELTWFATEIFRFHINFKSIWLWSRIPRLPRFYGKLCLSNVNRRVERCTDCSIIFSNKKLLFYFWNGPSNSFLNKICDHDSLYTLENCMLTSNILNSTQVLLIKCSPLVWYSGGWFHPLNSRYRD